MLVVGFGLCVWVANRPVCTECSMEEMWLRLTDGTPIFGRLYVPLPHADHIPVVVVCHGYLANLGFMEVPWAADLTHLGAAAFLLDRRGHGWSGGTWWPPAHPSQRLLDADPDIRAAIASLRSRTPLIDPDRIALLGHSDGATGVIMAASADWEVRATVSLSASAVPWEFVNHVAPANLLLLYGAEDRFVLAHTDQFLISSATRGYLEGEGMVGQLGDGSARRLIAVPGRGHVDLLYSQTARREALRWIAEALRLNAAVQLSPLRVASSETGVALLAALLLFWHGLPRKVLPANWQGWLATVVLAGLWTLGLLLAARMAPRMWWIPVEQGAVVVGVLCVEILVLAATISLLSAAGWGQRPLLSPAPLLLTNLGWGAAIGVAYTLALQLVLRPVYEVPLNVPRALLFLIFVLIALPAFVAIEMAGALVAASRTRLARRVPTEFVLAGLAAVVAPSYFARMAALPIYLLAGTLTFVGAYRAGGHRGGIWGAAAFGAVIYAHCMASVCAWY